MRTSSVANHAGWRTSPGPTRPQNRSGTNDARPATTIATIAAVRSSSSGSESSVTSRMPARTLMISLQADSSQPPAPSEP